MESEVGENMIRKRPSAVLQLLLLPLMALTIGSSLAQAVKAENKGKCINGTPTSDNSRVLKSNHNNKPRHHDKALPEGWNR